MKITAGTGTITLQRTATTHTASFAIISNNLAGLERQLHHLHPKERGYYDTLKADARRLSYLLGRLAAKAALLHYTGEREEKTSSFYVDFGVFQYPVVKQLPHAGIQVSITHCDHIGIAIAYPEEHPVSVDIEKITPEKEKALQALITAHDQQQLTNLGMLTTTGQTLLWTAKESLSKIVRTGLTLDARMMEVNTIEKMDQQLTITYQHWLQYKTISWLANDYACSLTLPRNTSAQLSAFGQQCLEACQQP